MEQRSHDLQEGEMSLDDSMNNLGSSRIAKGEDVENEGEGLQQAVQNWTGSKDQSLKAVMDYLGTVKGMKKVNLPEEFRTNTTVLLKNCLEDNNLNLYMQAVEVAGAFF